MGSEMVVSTAVRKALLSVGRMGSWTVDWWVSPLDDTKAGTSAKRSAVVWARVKVGLLASSWVVRWVVQRVGMWGRSMDVRRVDALAVRWAIARAAWRGTLKVVLWEIETAASLVVTMGKMRAGWTVDQMG